ncbi:unnamed protein product [Durusdinium trenchii]|uniref:Uncharacterized protein n=1 Tax=Durusdinium trenchii TaxID=1381693 RepID=A0ABP0ILM9_9DINO
MIRYSRSKGSIPRHQLVFLLDETSTKAPAAQKFKMQAGAGRIQKRVLERGKEAVGYKSEALGEGRGRCLDTEAEELLPQGVDLEYHTGHVETSHLAEEAAADDVSGSEEGTGSSSSSGVSSGTAE